jgi:TPR repeat protein
MSPANKVLVAALSLAVVVTAVAVATCGSGQASEAAKPLIAGKASSGSAESREPSRLGQNGAEVEGSGADKAATNAHADRETRYARIRSLQQDGGNAGAVMAFKLLHECAGRQSVKQFANNLPRDLESDKLRAEAMSLFERLNEECAEIPPAVLRARRDLLKPGLVAGDGLAAVGFYGAGPTDSADDIYIRPQDPSIKAWYQEAVNHLEFAARRGSLDAIAHLALIADTGPYKDRIATVAYLKAEVATLEVHFPNLGERSARAQSINMLKRRLAREEAALSEGDKAAVIEIFSRVSSQR